MASILNVLYQYPIYLLLGAIALTLWSLLWKGIGLWYASKFDHQGWFVAMLVLNTAGILPIIYLIFIKPSPEREVIEEILVQPIKKSLEKKKPVTKEKSSKKEDTETKDSREKNSQ